MAIEPIKGFYVHDEATNTDGVAKVSIDAVHEFIEDVSGTVENWLDEHPEATTTVQDGAVTTLKLADDAVIENKVDANFLRTIKNAYVTPEVFGAKGDGTTDDTVAVQLAINDGRPVFMTNRYRMTEEFVIDNNRIVMCPGEIRYIGAGSAVVVTGSNNTAYFKKITSAGNGVEMRPSGVTTNATYNCINDVIYVDTIYCTGQNVVGFYLNATDGLIQFSKFDVNRVQGEWNTKTIDGIKVKATNASNKYCNGNVFNISSIAFTNNALIVDAVAKSCFDNVFNDVHFEQNNTAIDVSNAQFAMSARFDAPTHGVIKIKDGTHADIKILSGDLNENHAFEQDPTTTNGYYHFIGSISDGQGNAVSNELYITKWGIYAPNIFTPTYTLYKLTKLYGSGAVGYLQPDGVVQLPAVRLSYSGNPCPKYTYKYSAPSLGSCTAEFTDGTTQTITWTKYSGVLEVYPTRDGTGQSVVVN